METMQLLKRTPTEDLRNHIYYGYLLLFQRHQSSKLWELTVGQNLTAPCFVPLSTIITTRNSQVVIVPERTIGCKEETDYVLFQVLGISNENRMRCIAKSHLSHSSAISKRMFVGTSKNKKEEVSDRSSCILESHLRTTETTDLGLIVAIFRTKCITSASMY